MIDIKRYSDPKIVLKKAKMLYGNDVIMSYFLLW